MTVREQLAALRRQAGLTQQQLGEALGVDQSYVSRVEIGRRALLSLQEIERWVETCGHDAHLVVLPQGGSLELTGRDPESVEAAAALLDAWPHLSARERRVLREMLRPDP